jgi:hypothetical protein
MLRASKAQTAMGAWHLFYFYDELCELPEPASEQKYVARLEFFHQWVSAQPKSITARIALANGYTCYAWHARGHGFASTVTQTGEQLFEERLKQAAGALKEAKQLEAKCPVWWVTAQYVALGLGWPLSIYNRIFDEAVAFEPNYTLFYYNKVNFLLPRWYGREGDWQRFASGAADILGGEAGDILYARIGWRIHKNAYYKSFMQDAGYSWPRMEKGMEAIVKNYPDSLSAASELAYLSYRAGDRTVAKPLFERIGNKVDSDVWRDDKARFLKARAWASGVNPASYSALAGPGK